MKKLIALFAMICAVVYAAEYTPVTKEVGLPIKTTATVTVTAATLQGVTPDFAGQILVGTVSNVVAVSKGTTTNDWIRIAN